MFLSCYWYLKLSDRIIIIIIIIYVIVRVRAGFQHKVCTNVLLMRAIPLCYMFSPIQLKFV